MPLTPKLTEAQFTRQVIQYARLCGWRVLHIRPARTNKGWRTPVQGDGVGWPDLFLVRRDRALALELKSDKGRTRPEQMAWLGALEEAGVCSYVIEPSDWPWLENYLA